MTDPEHTISILLGTLQLITIGLIGWTLSTLVKLLQRMSNLEGKFDAFPIQQINNNRHRIEQLERHEETVLLRLTAVERAVEAVKVFCGKNHNSNL